MILIYLVNLLLTYKQYAFCYRRRVDTTKISDVASAIGPMTKLVWLESPTNPRQQITDIKVRTLIYEWSLIF
jgi:cystathionine beta-lyase/cystathionine gamma-synthase